jgi:predicted site-specific integrase-resolvase
VAAKYAGVSLKIFRRWLANGLRHSQLANGRILTKYEWIDAYLEKFEVRDDTAKLQADELTEGLTGGMR